MSWKQVCDQCGLERELAPMALIETGAGLWKVLKNLPPEDRMLAIPNFCSESCRSTWQVLHPLPEGFYSADFETGKKP